MSSSAALLWKNHLYKKISRKLGLQVEEEEIQLLKLQAEKLRTIREKLVTEKHD